MTELTGGQPSSYHIKLLLKFFVGIIDAELLKCILIKHLKSIYIQYSNERPVSRGGGGGGGRGKARVNDIHNPVKECAV